MKILKIILKNYEQQGCKIKHDSLRYVACITGAARVVKIHSTYAARSEMIRDALPSIMSAARKPHIILTASFLLSILNS